MTLLQQRDILLFGLIVLLAPTIAAGTTFTLTDQQDFLNGSLVNLDPDGSPGDLKFGTRNDSDPALVAYWRLDDSVQGEGGTVTDYSGNGHHGTTGGGVTTGVEGVGNGQAMSFDGDNDEVVITNFPSIESSITVSAWVKSTAGDTYTGSWNVVSRYDQFILGPNGGEMDFIVYTPSNGWTYLDPPTTPNKDQWHHFVGTWNADTGRGEIWIDGQLHDTGNFTPDHPSTNTDPVDIGHRERNSQGNNHLQAEIDEVKIFERDLDKSEIKDLYNSYPAVYSSNFLKGESAWPDISWEESLSSETDLKSRVQTASTMKREKGGDIVPDTNKWKYRKKITLDAPVTNEGIFEYVRVNLPSGLSSSNPQDEIRIFNQEGIEVASNVLSSSSSSAVVAFNASISASEPEVYWLYYGNPSPPPKNNVFNNYRVDFRAHGDDWDSSNPTYYWSNDGNYVSGPNWNSVSGTGEWQSWTDLNLFDIIHDKTLNDMINEGNNREATGSDDSVVIRDMNCDMASDSNFRGTSPPDYCSNQSNQHFGLFMAHDLTYNSGCYSVSTFTLVPNEYNYQQSKDDIDHSFAVYAYDIDYGTYTDTCDTDKAVYDDDTYTILPVRNIAEITIGEEQKMTLNRPGNGNGFLSKGYETPINWANWRAVGGKPLKPFGQWKFEEASGQIAEDNVGNSDGILGSSSGSEISDPQWTEDCRYDDCLKLDGTDDYVDIEDGDWGPRGPFGISNTDVSVSLWMRADHFSSASTNHNTKNGLFANSGGFDDNFELGVSQDTIYVYTELTECTDDTTVTPSTSLHSKTWYHITVTKSASEGLEIYKNGEKVANYTDQGCSFNVSETQGFDPTIGSSKQQIFFDGKIDDVRLYNRSLTPTEIHSLYRGTSQQWRTVSVQARSSNYSFQDSGLVGSWSFEGSGQYVIDRSSNGNHGVLGETERKESEDAQRSNGYSGGGLSANGSEGVATIPSSTSLQMDASLTQSAWIKPVGDPGGGQRGTIATKNSDYYFQHYQDDRIAVYTYWDDNGNNGGSEYFYSDSTVPRNEWTHVAWTEENGERTIYINGEPDATGSYENTIHAGSEPLQIGAQSSGNRQFNGTIDEVRIYDRALSESEIKELSYLSDFSDPITDSTGQSMDVSTSTRTGNSFGVKNYQYKLNLLSGSSISKPSIRSVTVANTSGWSPWYSDPTGVNPNVPDKKYAQVQFNFSSTDVLQTPILQQFSILANYDPELVEGQSFSDSSDQHSYEVSTVFKDGDGDDDIQSCSVSYTGSTGSGSFSGDLNRGHGNDQEVQCNATIHDGLSGVEVEDAVDTSLSVTDSEGATASTATATHVVPNRNPTIVEQNDFTNYSIDHAFNITAVAEDVDEGSEELDSCTILHNNSDTSYESSGTLDTGYGSTDQAECHFTLEIGEGSFQEYEPNEKISVRVNFTDKHGAYNVTEMTSNTLPNDPPTINLDDTTPDGPEFGDEVEIFANISDPENDQIQWANFTIWEYNDEGQEQLLIDNENGSVTADSSYDIWTADNITADLENGTYNWTVEVSDPWATAEETGEFTLEEVSPDATSPQIKIAGLWDLSTDVLRPDQTLSFTADIIDLNGRSDLVNYYANISSPSGLEASYLALTEEEIITNGYTFSRAFGLEDAEEGTWTVTVWGKDQQGLIGQNSSTFEVTTYDNVTLRHDFDMTGSLETRNSDFNYVLFDGDPALTGLINYDGFLDQSGATTETVNLTMTQSFQNNQFILPYTAASIGEVDELREEFSASLLGGRSFLDYNIASIAYELHDELDVTIELSYFDNDEIYLRGFNGSLGRGQHDLTIENDGVEDGMTVVEVRR